MNGNRVSDEEKIIKLLEELKTTDGKYPPELFKKRRDMFINRVMMLAASKGPSQPGKGTGTSGSSMGGIIIQGVLAIVLIVELIVVAYIFREEILDFVQPLLATRTPTPAVVGTFSVHPTVELQQSTGISSTGMPTEVPVLTTPVPIFTVPGPQDNLQIPGPQDNLQGPGAQDNSQGTSPQDNPPESGDKDKDKDDKGKHLGQTPGPSDSPGQNPNH